jgi:hypothetical protein
MTAAPTLGELTTFMTSKNAGPFLVTIDAVFASREQYERVRDARILTPDVVARLYQRTIADVVDIIYFDPAKAIKVTMRRALPSGSPGDTDVYGAQQHVPLMNFRIVLGDDRQTPVDASSDS